MAKRPGVYLFEAGVHEDILANDGKFAVDEFLAARRILNTFSSLSFASNCSINPIHYEEDLVQEERRTHFAVKDWALVALTMDEEGKITKALLVNLEHHEEGFLVDLRYGVILVAFYRGFDIREFPDMPVQLGVDFLSSIGIAEEEYAVTSDYSLDEDDEEAPIIEVEKPKFVANAKKKIVNFGGIQIAEPQPESDDDEEIQIDVDRPSFQAGKKNKIRNLGSSHSVFDDDDDEVTISIARPAFQAGGNKKPRNLDATPERERRKPAIEQPEHIEVARPTFVAGKKGKIRNIVDEPKVQPKPQPKPVQKPARVEEEPRNIAPIERPAFTPARKETPSKIRKEKDVVNKTIEVAPVGLKPNRPVPPKPVEVAPVVEEKNWVFTDVFKLKPRVFQGERAVLHDPKAKGDEKYFEDALSQLSKISSIRISKNCVFVPEVFAENDPRFEAMQKFDVKEWDALAVTLNQDEQVLYVFLANKIDTNFCVLVSFKHKRAHIVVMSNKGGAIDDRALPYYSYADLRAVVFGK